MKLTMLGTGNALVTECYNTCFVIEDKGQYFMVDGGGGSAVLHQLKHAGYNWTDVRHIFVTHKHIDHLMGIIWMVRMICQFMNHGTRFIDDRLHLIEVHDGEAMNVIGHETAFFDIRSTKAKQYGFCMDLGDGKKLTCCGDEPYEDCEEAYARNSEWLLHEAFCLYSERALFDPYEKHHSTVKDACQLAEKLNVRNLLLYHTEDKNLADRKRLYLEEGAQYYHGNLFIPDDLESFVL